MFAEGCATDISTSIFSTASVFSTVYGDDIENDNPYEILVGNTLRQESQSVDADDKLSYLDYVVKFVGTKIVIKGGSDDALANAVEYFKTNYVNESIATVDGFKGVAELDYRYDYEPSIGKFTINGEDISSFKVVSRLDRTTVNNIIADILAATGVKLSKGTEKNESEFEILIGECDRDEYRQVQDSLKEYDYAVEVVNNKLVITGMTDSDFNVALDKFLNGYLNMKTEEFDLNKDNDIHYVDVYEERIITVDGITLRDPCVLLHDGVYYMYGTWWQCFKNTTGNLESGWERMPNAVVWPEEAINDYWAPEVHEYKGKFYMFTTYRSSKNDQRGSVIFRADSPEGPFVQITDGHITPSDRNCIDATLYVDKDGQPWMVFVLEWVDYGMGGMACAKLSDDLTHLISEPVELFDADAPAWTSHCITDGPWLYTCEDGTLLMIWSNFTDSGVYSVGIARSTTGLITGPWTQDDEVLFPVTHHRKYDGGHGMLFYDIDGNMWMSIHSPNSKVGDRSETPVFIPLREENGTLVFDDRER